MALLALAAALGAGSTLLGVALADDGDPAGPPLAPTTSTSAPPAEDGTWWHDPHETLIGPAAVIPETLTVDEGVATLSYLVEAITTARHGFVLESEDIPPVAPEGWELVTPTGSYHGTASRTRARQVRFEVDDTFAAEAVTAIHVTRHWMRIPYQYVVGIDGAVGASATVDEGLVLTIDAVLEQAETTLIQLDLEHPSEAFGATDVADFWILESGPAWGPTNVNISAGGGYALTYLAPQLPDRVELSIWSSRWIPFATVTDLDIGGLQRAR